MSYYNYIHNVQKGLLGIMKILVAYASKHGSTAEIAAFIGQTLQEQDMTVDVISVAEVTNLVNYAAVIVGSAVYSEQWRPAAAQFLKMRADVLAQKPVWLFSSGPTGHGEATELLGGFTFPEKLQPIANSIKPQDITVFHGRLDLTKLSLAELMIVKRYGGPLGDFRQWNIIKRWALDITEFLTRHDTIASV